MAGDFKYSYRRPDMLDWYSQDKQNEVDLIESVNNEYIEAYGIPCKYLRATLRNTDTILGDDMDTIFEESFDIYLLTPDQQDYVNSSFLWNKFGIVDKDELTLFTTQKRYLQLSGDVPPAIEDWIWIPAIQKAFSISFIEDEAETFLTLGRFINYQFHVKAIEYSHETLDTGIAELDALETREQNQPGVPLDDGVSDEAPGIVDWDEDDPFGDIGGT